jgi:Kef-type K+ transport system membrane component KefB
MNSSDFVLFALQIAAMLACAIVCGQLMRRVGQPAVLGEMIGGIILGPTIFSALAPGLYSWLFHSSAEVTIVRDASIKLGMLFFLFVAGLEVNLSDLQRLGRRAVLIGSVGTFLPLAAGVALAYALPRAFWGMQVNSHFFAFALFLGLNLANSANPVIARILMDLGLLRDDLGAVIMTATVIDDLVNWTLFAVILSYVAPVGQTRPSVAISIGLLLFLCSDFGCRAMVGTEGATLG